MKIKYAKTALVLLFLVILPSAFLIPCIIDSLDRCGVAHAEGTPAEPPTMTEPTDPEDFSGIGEEHRDVLVEQRTVVRRAIQQADSIEESLVDLR